MTLGINRTATIGRDTQLALVDDLIRNVANRSSVSLLFSGEPGIGKSHLLRESVTRSIDNSLRVRALRCTQNDIAEPFSFFLRLGAILDLDPPSNLDTDVQRFRFGRRVLEDASKVPTVIVVDDLQWLDYLSSVTLVHLFDYAMTLGLGFIGSTRPIEDTEDAGVIVNMRTLARLMSHSPLPGLSRSEVSQMIANEAPRLEHTQLENSLLLLTSGNPFFVLELLHSNESSSNSERMVVPLEVEAILDQRINLLGENEEILAFAALLGVHGDRRILSSALHRAGFDDKKATGVLQEAERLRLLTLGLDTYEFRHALYTQRLLARLSFLRRCAFHATAALTFAAESKLIVALTHLISAGASIDIADGVTIARGAFDLSRSRSDHTGVADAGTWLMQYCPMTDVERIGILIPLASSQLAIGQRTIGRRNAQIAFELSRLEGDVEAEAAALMQWSARCDFTPDRGGVIAGFQNIDLDALTPNTRIAVLSARAHAVTMIPTEEYVSISVGSRLITEYGQQEPDFARPETSDTAAWNWLVQSDLARRLSAQALEESQAPQGISADAQVQALLAWRETHRAPEFLDQRLGLTSRAMTLVNDSSPKVESVRFCRILDLLESGDYSQADLEIAQFHSWAHTGGSFIAQWWSEFLKAGRLINKGELRQAANCTRRAYERGESADEPGRLIVMLEQQTMILLESIIPPEFSRIFSGESEVLANHYARVTAALANASLGNVEIATRYVEGSIGILADPDREAAWLPSVTTLVETAHLLGLFEIAAQARSLLEPFARHQVTFIGNTTRGPVRRFLALAKHASGDVAGAVDDLLVARNEARHSGEHLWSLACSVDLLEMLATVDPERAIRLVPEEIIVEAEASEMKWRAQRGRQALDSTRNQIARQAGFSDRQILVLRGIIAKSTIKDIAVSLGFSHSTVRQESIAIYRQLNVSGRAEVIDRARELMIA